MGYNLGCCLRQDQVGMKLEYVNYRTKSYRDIKKEIKSERMDTIEANSTKSHEDELIEIYQATRIQAAYRGYLVRKIINKTDNSQNTTNECIQTESTLNDQQNHQNLASNVIGGFFKNRHNYLTKNFWRKEASEVRQKFCLK